MEVIAAALISGAVAVVTVLLTSRVNKRLGIPSDAEQKINRTLNEVVQSQELEIEARKRAEGDCMSQLAAANAKIMSLTYRIDEVEAQNHRLFDRLADYDRDRRQQLGD